MGQTLKLNLLVGEDVTTATPEPRYVGLRLGLSGANKAYEDVALTVALNGRLLHEGPAGGLLQVTRGKRHGNGSHAPPTEAYVQWHLADRGLLREGWNELEVTLMGGKPELSLQVVEAEIGIIP